MDKITGVGVDKGAVSLHDPVTVVVTAGGIEMDADDWSHANNLIGGGATVKPGYPRFPGDREGAPKQPSSTDEPDNAGDAEKAPKAPAKAEKNS